MVLQAEARGSAKITIARPDRDILLHAKDKTKQCNVLMKIRNKTPAHMHHTLTISSMNAFRDNFYSVVIQTPFKSLKKAQSCQILVGESFPKSNLTPEVVQLMFLANF